MEERLPCEFWNVQFVKVNSIVEPVVATTPPCGIGGVELREATLSENIQDDASRVEFSNLS